jgi:hypothetical protein
MAENDLQKLKMWRWKQKANNREEGASVAKSPRFLEDGRTKE